MCCMNSQDCPGSQSLYAAGTTISPSRNIWQWRTRPRRAMIHSAIWRMLRSRQAVFHSLNASPSKPMPRSAFRRITPLFASAATLIGLCASAASAANFNWNNTTGEWSVGANWGGIAPTGTNPTDTLTFGGDVGASIYTADNDITGPFLLNQLILQASDSTLSGFD